MKLLKKFGSHYAIERFGIVFLSLVICMGALMSSIVIRKVQYETRALSGTVQYTSSFNMSLTDTTGTVRGIYTNQAQNKVFLLLQFDDLSSISVDAEDYMLFLSGVNRNFSYDELQSHPNAMIYMFGNTGYMGIYLYSSEKFPSQIMNLYLRCMRNFSGAETTTTYEDETFNKYNQARIYFNPGGQYVTYADFLETDDWTVSDVYEEIVTRPSEIAIRQNMYDCLMEMRNQKLLMNEYSARLEKDGLMAPDTPVSIANDRVYAKPRDKSKDIELTWSEKQNVWYDADTLDIYNADDVRIYLDTKYVEPGGYHFNWQNSQIKNGYLKDLTGSDSLTEWRSYLEDRANDDTQSLYTTEGITWKYQDGSVCVPDNSELASSRDKAIATDIGLLQAAWESYQEYKTIYQVEYLSQLLQLEYDLNSVKTNYTIDTNEDKNLIGFW